MSRKVGGQVKWRFPGISLLDWILTKASTHYENGRHLFKEKLLKKITPLLLFVEEDFGTDIVNLGKFSASRL